MSTSVTADAAATDPSRTPPVAREYYDLLTPKRRWLAGIVLALSNFMVVLDLTIANVSVPHIAGDLGVSMNEGTWVITSYAVAEAICVPLTGWLAERYGAVRIFLLAMLGFGLFSMLCGFSQSLPMLVVCRIGQGLCGAPIMPMSQTLLVRVFPPKQRPAAMALWAMTTIIGPASGPILGGIISDNLTWHWVFFINVPIAMVISFLGYLLLMAVESGTVKRPIDAMGLALLCVSIGSLQILLDIGRDHDWFADWRMVALGLAAAIGFVIFVIWELTEEHPVVDLRIFRHRGFTTTMIVQALGFGAFFSSVVVVPLWLQESLGYTATKAGTVSAMHAMCAVMVAPFVAKLLTKIDPRAMVSFGTAWLGLMALVRSHWTSGADFFSLAWPMFSQGIGIPLMFIPLTTMALSAVDPEETASAAGLQNFVRTMATAISTSITLTVWSDSQTTMRDTLVGRFHPAAAWNSLTNLGMSPDQARATISNMVEREAITLAVDHTFFLTVIILFIASAVVWLTPHIPLTRMTGKIPAGH